MKLKEDRTVNTFTYEYENDYFVDIVCRGKYKEAYLYHNRYRIKSLMFGVEIGMNEMLEMIEADIDSYIKDYKEEYED